VHLSGGMWISHADGTRRLLDDHLHSPPDAVFELLRALKQKTAANFDVILERDGNQPGIESLLAQLDLARAAVRLHA
jgi:uncharacterized protein (UPF0276 family)